MKTIKNISSKVILQAAKEFAKGNKDLEKGYIAGFNAYFSLRNITGVRIPKRYDRRYKLTEENIKEIRKLRKDGYTLRALASKFNVSIQCILYHTNDQYRMERNKWKGINYSDLDENKKRILVERTKESRDYKRSLKLKGLI